MVHEETLPVEEKPKKRRKFWRYIRYILLILLLLGGWLIWEMRRVFPDEPKLFFAVDYKPPALTETLKKKPRCPSYQKGKKRVFWGDLHVHTSYSVDSYFVGMRNDPSDAYAFGQGKPVPVADGHKIKLERPLDFMAVTDHAEYFAVYSACFHPKYRNLPICMAFRNIDRLHRYPRALIAGILGTRDFFAKSKPKPPLVCDIHSKSVDCEKMMVNTWKHVQAAAQNAYKRCQFTTFIGYEWTATPGGSHLHRNVIYANAQVPNKAYDYLNYTNQTKLWKALEKGCKKEQGCDVITIPHNLNWSDGLALKLKGSTPEERRLRAKYERVVEIHQAKGNSECLYPFKDDRGDCNFEIAINRMSEALTKGTWWGIKRQPMTKERWEKIRSSYVRGALQRGILHYSKSKAKLNPLQLGFIGSTDTHNGTPGAVGPNIFTGSHGDLDVSPRKRLKYGAATANNPGGLAAVWAEENTRESIFAALKRRETYATSGPRIMLRFGQTWSPSEELCKGDFSKLTPMGSTLTEPPQADARPHFVVQALMDKTRLARVDIITATVKNGKLVERVLRFKAKDAKQGDTSICQVWRDASFSAGNPTFWYARVLEKPTPRWSFRECKKLGNCDKIAKKYRKNIQQRAWSSPIWYHPK